MRLSILVAAVLLSSSSAVAADPEFETHQVILLVRGAKWTPQKTPETEKLQAAHLAHLTKMASEGKMVVAGPFDKQSDDTLRGLCIYKVATLDEAIKLASEDPAVKAGRLKIVSMNWWTEKGYIAFPRSPMVIKPK